MFKKPRLSRKTLCARIAEAATAFRVSSRTLAKQLGVTEQSALNMISFKDSVPNVYLELAHRPHNLLALAVFDDEEGKQAFERYRMFASTLLLEVTRLSHALADRLKNMQLTSNARRSTLMHALHDLSVGKDISHIVDTVYADGTTERKSSELGRSAGGSGFDSGSRPAVQQAGESEQKSKAHVESEMHALADGLLNMAEVYKLLLKQLGAALERAEPFVLHKFLSQLQEGERAELLAAAMGV